MSSPRKSSGKSQVTQVWLMIGGLIVLAIVLLVVAALLVVAWF